MNEQLPELSAQSIRTSVQATLTDWAKQDTHRRGPQPRLFAFYGTGSYDRINLDNNERLEILPIRSEIDLRAQLPALDAAVETKAYLVPWQNELPLDLAGRFAKQGRVIPIGQSERLRALLGGAMVDTSLSSHPLGKYLLRSDNPTTAYRVLQNGSSLRRPPETRDSLRNAHYARKFAHQK